MTTAGSAARLGIVTICIAVATTSAPGQSFADVPTPLSSLVDAAAQRLQTADAVAASKWTKGGPPSAPLTAPDLADSRSAIDVLNRTMVAEIAGHWDSLHSPSCAADLANARGAVVLSRGLDDLLQRGLDFATSSYCE